MGEYNICRCNALEGGRSFLYAVVYARLWREIPFQLDAVLKLVSIFHSDDVEKVNHYTGERVGRP
jgi:hypothetical protein